MDAVARFKVWAALLIWALALVGGAAPFVGGRRIGKRVNSALNMVAAGIFLAGSCLHLLPDAQANSALSESACIPTADGGCFQWANFLYGCGFILVMLVEVSAHHLHRSLEAKEHEEQCPHENVHVQVEAGENGHSYHEVPVGAIGADASMCGHEHSNGRDSPDGTKDSRVYAFEQEQRRLEIGGEERDYGSVEKSSLVLPSPAHDQRQHVHGMVKTNPILALVVLLALSFHSVMEGMGVGAANHEAWDILIAILAHKSLAAFALALEFLHHRASSRQMLVSLGTFSLMTPLGILLGSMLVNATHETPASGVCSALAGGTFLYVAIMEIIPQELQDPCHLFTKCSALVAGYCAMGALSIWT